MKTLIAYQTINEGYIGTLLDMDLEPQPICYSFLKDKNSFIKIRENDSFLERSNLSDKIYAFSNENELINFLKKNDIDRSYYDTRKKDALYYYDNTSKKTNNLIVFIAEKNLKQLSPTELYALKDEKLNQKLDDYFKEVDFDEWKRLVAKVFPLETNDFKDYVYEKNTFQHTALFLGDKLVILVENLNKATNINFIDEEKLPKNIQNDLKDIEFNQQTPDEILASYNIESFQLNKIKFSNNRQYFTKIVKEPILKKDKEANESNFNAMNAFSDSLFAQDELKTTTKTYFSKDEIMEQKMRKRNRV